MPDKKSPSKKNYLWEIDMRQAPLSFETLDVYQLFAAGKDVNGELVPDFESVADQIIKGKDMPAYASNEIRMLLADGSIKYRALNRTGYPLTEKTTLSDIKSRLVQGFYEDWLSRKPYGEQELDSEQIHQKAEEFVNTLKPNQVRKIYRDRFSPEARERKAAGEYQMPLPES